MNLKTFSATLSLSLLLFLLGSSAKAQSFGDAVSGVGLYEPTSEQFKIMQYIDRARAKISHHWQGTQDKYKKGPLVLSLTIALDGTISRLIVKSSSGALQVDEAALNAVRAAQPFEKLSIKCRNSIPCELYFTSAPQTTQMFYETLPTRVQRQTNNAIYEAKRQVDSFFKPSVQKEPQRDVDFGPYMVDLNRKIRARFQPLSVDENRQAQVLFTLHDDGHVSGIKLLKPSPESRLNDIALNAVRDAAPFANLPKGAPPSLDIQFTFDLRADAAKQKVFQIQVAPQAEKTELIPY